MIESRKILGVDYGQKHVGIALSDDSGRIAFPREIIPNDSQLIKKILDICTTENVTCIVFGKSLANNGKENFIMDEIYSFIDALKSKTTIPIELIDESFTTFEAGRYQTGRVDDSAAALLLQRYLDTMNKS